MNASLLNDTLNRFAFTPSTVLLCVQIDIIIDSY